MKTFLLYLLTLVLTFSQALHPDLEGVGVDEHYNQSIPTKVKFRNEQGKKVTLADYLFGDKPVLFNFVYYNCTSTCTELLNGLSKTIKELDGLEVGKDFDIVTLSIDPREGYQMAKAKKKNMLRHYNLQRVKKGWHYLTGEESDIKKITKALGFKYKWSARQEQYLHPAVIFILTSKGKISRYLYGVSFSTADIKLSLIEASAGKIGTTFDRFLLLCYTFDPTKGKYTKDALKIMSIAGGLTLLFVVVFLVYFWKREIKEVK